MIVYAIYIYIPGKPKTQTILVIVGKNRNDYFCLVFFPVMTPKMLKSKEHRSPTRSKTVFLRYFVEQKM